MSILRTVTRTKALRVRHNVPASNQQSRTYAEAPAPSPQHGNVPATAQQTLQRPTSRPVAMTAAEMQAQRIQAQQQGDMRHPLLRNVKAGYQYEQAQPYRTPQAPPRYLALIAAIGFFGLPPLCYFYWHYRKSHMDQYRKEKLADIRSRHGFADN